MKDAILLDMDGTLADVRGMRHYVLSDPRKKNFDAFHKSAAMFAPGNQSVLDAADAAHAAGLIVFVVTARKEQWRYWTSKWLREWDVPHDYLLMRRDNDNRKDVEVKREILNKILYAGFNVIHAWDDNPAIIDLWRGEGIPVTVVPGWQHEETP